MRRSLEPRALHAAARNKLTLADHGFFWVGAERTQTPFGTAVRGQACVEYFIPGELKQPWPLVLVHGGGGQSTDYLGTADGRPGWAYAFLREGYAVYLLDRPGHGRAPNHEACLGPMTPPATYEFISEWFSNPAARPERYQQARLHNQWPGSGIVGDPTLDHFMAGTGPSPADLAVNHLLNQRAGAELLDRIGPSILMTHSAGGPCGWMIADARPRSLKALIAVEPFGPPFVELGPNKLIWGLTAAPLSYVPAASSPDQLQRELRPAPRPGTVACFVQAQPARQLPNLQGYPIVVVTAEASWMATDNHGTVDYLRQAGAQVEHLRLEDVGIHGNGHAMMLEKNSDEIAGALHAWITRQRLPAT
jgi:pimeloyl-ACP methyl ester carboxylesterase